MYKTDSFIVNNMGKKQQIIAVWLWVDWWYNWKKLCFTDKKS